MLNKRLQEQSEAARNAISGYVAVVLAIVCFIIVLAVAMTFTRFFVGLSLVADTSKTTQVAPTVPVSQVTQMQG